MASSSGNKTTNKTLPEMVGLASTIPTNLPPLHGKLIGRDPELQAIYDLFTKNQERLVSLAGFGGVGKTTLAIHAAHALFEKFPGGLFFVDLTSIAEPAMILPCIAKVLGVQEIPNRELAETLRDFLANRSILFVLDNFEHLIEGAHIVSDFLMANPYVRILVTSRESLRLRGERVLPIIPLENELSMQVFVQYAQTLNPHFRLTEDNTPVIKELCKKLDGIPLAIELAAMRTRMFTPQALLARLQSDLGTDSPLLATLTSGPRDMPERQQTLRRMIAWSYNLLTDQEKYFLQAAAFFRSGFEIQILAQVTAVPENETEQVIISLVDKNLLQPVYESQARFYLLESIREFGLEQAKVADGWQELQSNFVFAFQELTQEATHDIETDQGEQGIPWLKAENSNMLAALEIALKADDKRVLTAGMFVLESFDHYWFPYCRYSEAKKYLSLAQQRVEKDGSDFDRAVVYGLLGTLRWSFFDLQSAVDFHRASADLFTALGDEKRLGRVLNNLAATLELFNRPKESEEYYLQSLNLAHKTSDLWNKIRVLCNLGTRNEPGLDKKNKEQKLEYLHQAHDLAVNLGRSYGLAIIEFNLSCIYYAARNLPRAIAFLEKCVKIADEHEYLQIMSFGRGLLGRIAIEQGAKQQAYSYLKQALEFSTISNFQTTSCEVVEVIAELCISNNQRDEAVILLSCVFDKLPDNSNSRTLPALQTTEEQLAQLKQDLGEERYARSFQKGRLMSLTEVYTLAFSLCVSVDADSSTLSVVSQFTNRELDVLRLLAQGKTNEEISAELVVVLKTVEKHAANIFRKLGVKNRTEAAAWAIENGLSGSKI